MVTNANHSGLRTNWTNLPVKITVLVFWGVALFCSIIAVYILSNLDEELKLGYKADADRVAYGVNNYINAKPNFSVSGLQLEMYRLHKLVGVSAIEIRLEDSVLHVGDKGAEFEVSKRIVHLHNAERDHEHRKSVLLIYHPGLGFAVGEQRRNLLITMGAIFLVFGFGLVWILQYVLTGPFTEMVDTAKEFSGGDLNSRFDESRDDEFGYLAKFVNQALDQSIKQQEGLKKALTQVQESETALFQEKERVEVTLHSIGDGVITTDAEGKVDYLNPVAERLIGLRLKEAVGQPLTQILNIVDENTREPMDNPVMRCLQEDRIIALADHAILLRRDHKELAISDSAAPIRDHSGNIIGAVMVFHDVGQARALQRELSYAATHDSLTGLYNRHEFEQRLKLALADSRDKNRTHVLCYLDLDQFKIVNDTCGHVAGDELLRQISILLQKQLRDADILARLGGDEFGILLNYCSHQHGPRIAEALCKTVKDFRFSWGERSFEAGVSIGLVNISNDSPSVSELLSAADVACYAAKDGGRNQVHVFKPNDKELEKRRGEMQWVSRLNKAIEDNRFSLFCQPILPLEQKSGRHAHLEILVRLVDEEGALVMPMAFIPAAERYGLMPEIDRCVIRNVFEVLRTQSSSNIFPWIIAINISGQSLCDKNFLDYVISLLEQTSINPDRVCFEITETAAVANLMQASKFIKVLKGMGCQFALDDFGSGLSSFAYLKNLSVDYLKIDGSFVKDMVSDPIDRSMVEAINQIGHVMGLMTIAEFVENDAILNELKILSVDYAQGYGITKPVPLEDMLKNHAMVPAVKMTGS